MVVSEGRQVQKKSDKQIDTVASEEKRSRKRSQKQTDLAVSEEKQTRKRSQKQTKKQTKLAVSEFPTLMVKDVYEAIRMNRKAKYSWLADNLGVSERTIQRAIDDLKKLGYRNSEHSKVKGEWQLLK